MELKKCLFPAAGYGTRFLPATKAMPKEMLPLVNKPLIQYGVEEAIAAGMTDIGVVSARGKRAVEDHFDITYELEHQLLGTPKAQLLDEITAIIETCTFSYTRQREMKGLGHAILTGQTLIGDNAFGVLLADDFCTNEEGPNVLEQMAALFEEYQCSIVAIEEVDRDRVQNYGIVDGIEIQDGLFKVSNMVEKPSPENAPTNLAIIGRYILTPDIFRILQDLPPGRAGEVQITDAINEQCKKRMVLAYKFKGQRFDCGSIEGFVEATNHVYHTRYAPGANYPKNVVTKS